MRLASEPFVNGPLIIVGRSSVWNFLGTLSHLLQAAPL